MGKLVDLVGQRFGKLTVIEQDQNYCTDNQLKFPRVYWRCRCDCGNIKSIAASSLRGGAVRSCGCLKNQDLIGERFGRLIVIGLLPERDKHRCKIYQCLCDCGNYTSVRSKDLISGNTKSCGCYGVESRYSQAIDLTNQKFGRLTVLGRGSGQQRGVLYWRCQCECGAITNVPSRNLREGQTYSCGCVRSKGEERIAKWLSEKNFDFVKEKSFPGFRYSDTGGAPRYDFFLPKYNILIEFNGIQHYAPIGGWNNVESFEQRGIRDNIKRTWAKNNGYTLYEIPYWEYDNLDSILENIINNIKKENEET